MSKQIDERVVEMRFDNSNFETNAKATMSTLDKLKSALKFNSASDSFKELDKASKNVDMSSLGNAIDTVHAKFSALEVIGVTALANITTSAIAAGKQLLKSLTVDQIMEGWNKYEQKVQAVQTIVSQGYDYDQVNAQLEKLNWFTDETSYNFLDMVNNIGKFTAQGQDLGKSVTAMEGISNWAALSGAGINGAARAMYNLSQALGVGYIKVQDWMSIENANMATKEFKDTVIETAKALGKLDEEGNMIDWSSNYNGDKFVDFTNFRTTLSAGWFDSEVLMATLQKYGKFTDELNNFVSAAASEDFTATKALLLIDEYEKTGGIKNLNEVLKETGYSADFLFAKLDMLTSAEFELGKKAFKAAQEATTLTQAIASVKDAASTAWMTIFETIFGGYDEARVTWTDLANDLYDLFIPSLTSINDYLSGEFDSSWQRLKKRIADTGLSSTDFTASLKANLEANGVSVEDLISKYGSFESGLKNVDDAAGYVSKTLMDYVNVLDAMSDEELETEEITRDQIEAMRALADTTSDANDDFYGLIDTLDELGGKELFAKTIHNALTGLIDLIDAIKKAWRNIFPPMAEKQLYNIIVRITEFSESLMLSEETLDKITRAFSGFFAIFDIAKQIISGFVSVITRVLSVALNGAGDGLLSLAANTGDVIVAFDKLLKEKNIITGFFDKIGDVLSFAVNKVRDFIIAIKESTIINGIASTVKIAFDAIKDAIGDTSLKITSFRDALDKLSEIKDKVIANINESVLNLKVDAELVKNSDAVQTYKETTAKILDKLMDKYGEYKVTTTSIINSVADFISDSAEELDVGTLFAMSSTTSMVVLLREFNKTLGKFTEIVPTFGKYLNTFVTSISSAVKKLAKAKAFEMITVGIRHMAESLLIIAGAMFILSKISPDRFTSVTAVMGAMLGAIMLFSVIMTKMSAATSKVPTKSAITGALTISTAFISIGASVLLLAKAMDEIKDLDTKSLLKTGVSIIVLMIALTRSLDTLLGSASLNIKDGMNLIQLALMIVSFAAAVSIMSQAVISLSEVKVGPLLKGLGTIVAIIAAFTLASKVLVPTTVNSSWKSIVALTTFGISLLTFAIAVKWIGSMDFTGVKNNLPVLIGIMASFAVLMLATHLAGEHAGKASIAIISMTASIGVFALGIHMLSSLSEGEIKQASLAISGLLAICIGLVAVSKLSGEHADKAGKMILSVALSMAGITLIISILSKMEPDKIKKGLLSVAAMAGIMAALIAVTHFSKYADKCQSMLTKLTGIFLVLTFCLTTLSIVAAKADNRLMKAAGSIALVIVSIGAMLAAFGLPGFKNLGKMNLKQKLSSILTFVAVVAALGALVAALTKISNAEGATQIALSLGALMLALSTSLVIISKMGELNKDIGNVIGYMAGISVIMVMLGTLVGILATVFKSANIDMLLPITGSIVLLLGGLTACVLALSVPGLEYEKLSGKTALSVVGLTLVAAALGTLLGKLATIQGMNVASLIPLAASMSILLLGLSSCVLILSATHFDPKSMATSVASVAGLALVVSGLAFVIAKITNDMSNAQAAIPLATALSELIIALSASMVLLTIAGSFGAAAISGVLSMVVAVIAIAGLAALIGILEEYNPYIDKGLPVLKKIATGLIDIAGYFLDTIIDSFIDAIPKIGDALSDFADKVKPFTDYVGTLDSKIVKGTLSLAGMLVALGGTEAIAAIQSIIGIGDFGNFKNKLVSLGEAMTSYLTVLKDNGISEDDLELIYISAKVGRALVSLTEAMGDGTVFSILSAVDDIGAFAIRLEGFGAAITSYSNSIANMNVEAVERSNAAIAVVVALANNLPETKTLEGWFSAEGANKLNMTEFGVQLVLFGKALVNYANEVTGLDVSVVLKSVTAAQVMSTFAKNLPSTKNIVGWFSSKNSNQLDMADFGKQLKSFGKALVSYANEVTDLNADVIDKSITAANALVGLANTLPETKTLAGWFSSKNSNQLNMEDFGKQLKSFGKALKDYSNETKGVTSDIVSKSSNIANAISNLTKNLPDAGSVSGWFNGGNKQNLSTLGNHIKSFGKDIKDYSKSLESVKTGTMNSVSSSVQTLLKALEGSSNTNYKEGTMYKIGQDAAQGFINGVNSKLEGKNSVWSIGTDLGNKFANAVRNATKEKSPSRVLMQIGDFAGEGFVIGVQNTFTKIKSVGVGLKDNLVAGLSGIATTLKEKAMAAMGIDDSALTITPVLDLSQIQNGASDIGSILGDYGLNFGGSMDMASLASGDFFGKNSATDFYAKSIFDQFKDFNAKDTIGSVTNTFNIQSSDPEGVAEEVSKILNQQLGRARVAWQ